MLASRPILFVGLKKTREHTIFSGPPLSYDPAFALPADAVLTCREKKHKRSTRVKRRGRLLHKNAKNCHI